MPRLRAVQALSRFIYLKLLALIVLVMLIIRTLALYEVIRCHDAFQLRLCTSFILSLLVETCPAVMRCFPFSSSYDFLGYAVLVYGFHYLESREFGLLPTSPSDAKLI